mmetsp:Transcript_25077/g.40654  ORF Transcript_25077/g.40654 Transcript_25077/m.40654 type:complete len:441 (+) Transcript_25077:417-1739(+)
MPMLKPQDETCCTSHFSESISRAKRYDTISSPSIKKTSRKNCTHFGQRSLMLVAYKICQLLAECLDLAVVASITLLHVNHGRSEQGSLSNVVCHISKHWLQKCDTIGIPSASHGNSHCHTTCITNVRIETLQQEADQLRNTFWGLMQHKCQPNHCSHSHIVANITHGGMEQDTNSLIGACAAVSQCQTIHGTIANNWVAISSHFFNGRISILLLSVVHQRQTHGNTTNNLLVVCFARVVTQFGDQLCKLLPCRGGSIASPTAHKHHPHGVTCSFTSYGTISVKQLFEFTNNFQVRRAKASQTHAQCRTVRNNFVCMRIPQMFSQEGARLQAFLGGGARVTSVDESKSVQGSTLGVSSCSTDGWVLCIGIIRWSGWWKVRFEKGHRLGSMTGMDDSHRGSGRKLGPITSLFHPIQIIPQKRIIRRPRSQIPMCRHSTIVQY